MSSSATVRIAVAGAGTIGRRHAELIAAHPGCALAGIVDVAPGAAEVARTSGVALHRSLAELFDTDRPDGVIVATPNQLHVEHGLECIVAGVPALIEKPIAHTVADGARLCAAAEQAGVPVLVGHHRRHSPIVRRATEIVRSGVLGPLVGVIGSAVFYKPDADGYFDGPNAWRRQPGGGPILLNMIHEVDNLRAIVGEIEAVQAFASSAIRGFPVEDTAAINLRFANGALGTFLLSDTGACPKSWEQTSQENKAYPSYGDEDAYMIVGTSGSLGVPTMRLRCYARPEDRSWFKPFATGVENVRREDPLVRQLEHFVAVIRGAAAPLVTCRDALQNLRVIEAIAEAGRAGCTVSTAA